MKKMRKGLGVLMAVVFMFVFASQAGAYCVHNNSDRGMLVKQTSNASFWKPFKADILSGQKACCHWTNKDCNKSGGQTDPVGFHITDITYMGIHRHPQVKVICSNFTIPANGNLYIKGAKGKYYCSQTP